MILAQQDADLMTVERPPSGNLLRGVGTTRGGVSASFVNTNWGKRSISPDLPRSADRASLGELIARLDVLVENFRPAVMTKLGFAHEDLCRSDSRLIYVAIRGFSSNPAMADAPICDHVNQAMTGF